MCGPRRVGELLEHGGSFASLVLIQAILVLVTASALSAQSIRGLVVEEGTDLPVELASVDLLSVDGVPVETVLTDSSGLFALAAPNEEFVLQVTAVGYQPRRIGPFLVEGAEGVRVVSIDLTPRPLEIEGIQIDALYPALVANGFYERRSRGRGQFLTPSDIAGSDARFTPEIFHGLDRVVPQYDTPPWRRWVTFMKAVDHGNCEPRIWIDGVRLPRAFRLPGEGLDDAVPVEDLLAAEVYWGPFQAPLKWQGTMEDNSCGVVVLWTRSGTAAHR